VTTGDVIADAFSRDRSYSGRSWRGDLAELMIYDRPLSKGERRMIESYLYSKYALAVPTVAPPTFTRAGGWAPAGGPELVQLDCPTAGAIIRFTTDDTEPTEASSVYSEPLAITGPIRIRARAFLPGWNPSHETAVTFLDEADFTPASLPNLALWVRADAGVGSGGSSWVDQGAVGNSLVQPETVMAPDLRFDDASRMPLLHFDGVDDTLLFAQRLTTIRTVFWVVRAEEAATGYRFLLGDASTYHFQSGSASQIWGSSARAAVRNGETRLNGELVDGRVTDRPTNLSVVSVVTTGSVNAGALSRDRSYADRSWWGDVAELVIYDRALSPAEVRSVEEFLAGRYDIALVP